VKVLLCVHGWPPELAGGTEGAAQCLAHELARLGDEVVVVAGTLERAAAPRVRESLEEVAGARPLRVLRVARADLHFDHWHKSLGPGAAALYREVLRAERPDVVHVHHWLRLTRELVLISARERVPAVVTLHDFWTTCPLVFRVRPDTLAPCDATMAADPCLACAAPIGPPTPWVPPEAQRIALAGRAAGLARELALARALIVPGRAHGEALRAQHAALGLAIAPRVVTPACALAPPDPSERVPLAPPGPGRPLVLGSWGHLCALKGTDLLFDALERLSDPERAALVLAGPEERPGYVDALRAAHPRARVEWRGPFARGDLARHAVTAVHAMVSATRARESHGAVLDEARALGLPAVLPRAGAFAQRAGPESGALLFEPGDAADLARTLARLVEEPGLVAALAARVPREVVSPGRHAREVRAILAAAAAAGPPDAREVPAEQWFEQRLRQREERIWDEALERREAAGAGEHPVSAGDAAG